MNLKDVKVFLVSPGNEPDEIPEEHVYINGLEPWQIEPVAKTYMKCGPMKSLEDDDIWDGAEAVKNGTVNPTLPLWLAYYDSVKSVDMFPDPQKTIDVTDHAVKAVMSLKKLAGLGLEVDENSIVAADRKSLTPIPVIVAKDHRVTFEHDVGLFVARYWINRAQLPPDMRAAIVLNSKAGAADVHLFDSSPEKFQANIIITSLFGKPEEGRSSGHRLRARSTNRPEIKMIHQAVATLVATTHTREELGWNR